MRSSPRSTEPELLDRGGLDPAELRRNLAEMAMLNRLPGGVEASVRATLRLLDGRGSQAAVLDAGTGAGDYARRLRSRTAARLLLADASAEVLAVTRRSVAGIGDVELLRADARSLPLPDDALDVAHASLLLHHLDPPDVVAALRELRRVATRGIVVNDLRRGTLAGLMVAAPVLALARSPVTRHDGVLSARRAYTLAELDDLAAEAGLRPVARTAAWWPRVTTTYR